MTLWDVLIGSCVRDYGRVDIAAKEAELFTPQVVPAWFSVDTRLGALACRLDPASCFSAEVYAQDLGFTGVADDQKFNLGDMVVEGLLSQWRDRYKGIHGPSAGGASPGRAMTPASESLRSPGPVGAEDMQVDLDEGPAQQSPLLRSASSAASPSGNPKVGRLRSTFKFTEAGPPDPLLAALSTPIPTALFFLGSLPAGRHLRDGCRPALALPGGPVRGQRGPRCRHPTLGLSGGARRVVPGRLHAAVRLGQPDQADLRVAARRGLGPPCPDPGQPQRAKDPQGVQGGDICRVKARRAGPEIHAGPGAGEGAGRAIVRYPGGYVDGRDPCRFPSVPAQPAPEAASDPLTSLPELELLVNGQLVPYGYTLATVRKYLCKGSDVLFHFRKRQGVALAWKLAGLPPVDGCSWCRDPGTRNTPLAIIKPPSASSS